MSLEQKSRLAKVQISPEAHGTHVELQHNSWYANVLLHYSLGGGDISCDWKRLDIDVLCKLRLAT